MEDDILILSTFAQCINGDEEKAASVWNNWNDNGLEDMNKDEVYDLFYDHQ